MVLMSSHDDAKMLADDFRTRTGIVGGMFYFLPESDLTNRVKLLLDWICLRWHCLMAIGSRNLLTRQKARMEAAVNEFLTDIKRLNIDDYVYIQRLSLQADGHPLGDYLLWLYSAYFGHLLFEHALSTDRRELDELTFEDWVPSQVVPSTQLTAMYHAALFDTTVVPLGPHPRWTKKRDAGIPPDEQAGVSTGEGEELPVTQDVTSNVAENSIGDGQQGG